MAGKVTYGPASPVQKQFWDDETTDVIIFGGGAGSGKTMLTLLKQLKYIDCEHYRAVFIRKTTTELTQSGGLQEEMRKVYSKFGAKSRLKPQMSYEFKSGAKVSLMSCERDAEVFKFDGGQYTFVCFDEAQNHSFEQFSYLQGRMRTPLSKYKPRMVLTCNPLKGSWLLGFTEWYLDPDTGIPTKEKAGTIRYWAMNKGSLVTADTAEELVELYPSCKPMTYRFIPATVLDNPIQTKLDPHYISKLENLRPNERNRLLLGSWFAVDEDAGHFKREWCKVVPEIPDGVYIESCMRAWDFACTLPSETNKNPDYTAGVKIARCTDGNYYVLNVRHFRARQHDVEEDVIKTAHSDGLYDCTVVIPRDPGVAGKNYATNLRKKLADHGIVAKESAVVSTTSKLKKFLPFTIMAHSGNVFVVKDTWNDVWFDELESFTGEYKDRNKSHDDMVDATADAFNNLHKAHKPLKFVLPMLSINRNIRK